MHQEDRGRVPQGRQTIYRIFVPESFRGPIHCSTRAFVSLSYGEKKTRKKDERKLSKTPILFLFFFCFLRSAGW
jgi:hypothetical protein